MNCFEHLQKPAVGTCSHCGRGLCKECATVVEGKLSCRGACQAEISRARQLMLKSERAADERSVVYGTTAKTYHQSFASAAFFALLFVVCGAAMLFTDAVVPGAVLLGLGIMLGIRSLGLSRAAKKYRPSPQATRLKSQHRPHQFQLKKHNKTFIHHGDTEYTEFRIVLLRVLRASVVKSIRKTT